MKFGRSKERKISRTPQDRIANIIFEKKNTTQARFKIGVKIILYLVTASFLGAIISGINVKNKYGEVMQQVKELSDNADNVILDYTKVIKIRFDNKNEYRINSYRAEEIRKQNKDERILI